MSSGFWKKFLIDAGIPVRAAESYTSAFVEHRITESMISDLSKSILMDLGITIIGDVIVILKHAIHLTEESNVEKQLAKQYKKRSKPEKKTEKEVPERSVKKDKKEETGKKRVKNTEDHTTQSSKTEESKKTTEKKPKALLATPAPSEKQTEKTPSHVKQVEKPASIMKQAEKKQAAPRKVRISEQSGRVDSGEEEPKQAPTQVKKKKVTIEGTAAVRTVSVPTKPPTQQKTSRVVSAANSTSSRDRVTHHVTEQSGRVSHQFGHAAHHQSGHVTQQSGHVTQQRVSHVTEQQRVSPPTQTVHLVRRRQHSTSSEESDTSSCVEERSPVTARRVYPRQPSTSPVIVRQLPGDTILSKSVQEEQVLTRNMPVVTRNVSCNVTRLVQTVRCVSPDSTTDIPGPSQPKQTTTVILNTKGKCSVRPVSPPEDMLVDRVRKVLPRGDGKSTLTRVVQRHLDSSSPSRSPKRHKNTRNKDVESLLSEKYNSFRSDAEGVKQRNVNKFRSEEDRFDVVTDQREPVRRSVRSRSMSGGRVSRRISNRLGGISRGPDMRRSLPAKVGGVAARVFSDNRLAPADRRSSPRPSVSTKSDRNFRSHRNESKPLVRSSPRSPGTTKSERSSFRSGSDRKESVSIFSRLGKY